MAGSGSVVIACHLPEPCLQPNSTIWSRASALAGSAALHGTRQRLGAWVACMRSFYLSVEPDSD
jgi:hypothetical protein